MTTKAVLWTKNKNQKNTYQVLIYCYNKGKKKYYGTGIFIPEDNWSIEKQEVQGIPAQLKNIYNEKIRSLKSTYQLKMAEGIPANQLDKEEEEAITQKQKDFLLFFENFIKQQTETIDGLSKGTLKHYKTTLKAIKTFCRDRSIDFLSFEDINMNFYHDFASHQKIHSPGITGFSNKIKIIKRIMRVSHEQHLHDNKIFDNPQFKRPQQKPGGKIYLTTDEIELLEKVDLSTMPGLEFERDRFLISYYFILRWVDSTRIEKKNVFKDEHDELHFSYISKKTKTKAVLPVSTKAQQLLLKHDYYFKGHTIQYANRAIKDIASMAGITKPINQGNQQAPKFKFVTSHTARRSAATNLYLAGMDLETLAKLGGWADLQMLRRYLRASGLEVSQNAKKFDFFK
jgi:site-specific recombinase XerD